jgi:hypothetical protein
LYQFGKAFIERSRNDKWKEFPEVSDGDLSDLSSDYCTILRMYNGSNALQVRIFSERNYSIELLKNLKPISENIIELDLLGLPIGGGEMKLISGFVNLEKLNLANTGLTDLDFLELENMKHLKSLKVYGTQISDSALESISNFPELTDLYVYDTDISDKGIENLNSTHPEINVIAVSKEAGSFKSVLPSPKIDPRRSFFSDPFYIKATLPLNGIDILFTRDGATPNDQSSKMSDSLEIDTSFKFKYLASKTGWEPSKVDSVMFFKSSFIPQDYTLENGPNSKYTGNGKIILFDLEKGPADYSDSAWMAFREASFILSCNFEKEVTLGAIVLSSIIQTDQYLFPPQSVKIYGGMEHGNLKLIGALKPSPLKERQQGHFEFYTCQTNTSMIKYLKIIVEPLEKLPIWHQGKGQPAWFFIDEVVLMEESPSF